MRMQKETLENDTGSSSFHLYSESHKNMRSLWVVLQLGLVRKHCVFGDVSSSNIMISDGKV